MWFLKNLIRSFKKSSQHSNHENLNEKKTFEWTKKINNFDWYRRIQYSNWDIYNWNRKEWKKEWFWKYIFKNWNIYEGYRKNDKRNWYWIFIFHDWRKRMLNRINWEADLNKNIYQYNPTIEWWMNNWTNIYTWTKYDWWWYTQNWFDKNWIHKFTWTKYDPNWFNIKWLHKETWKMYNDKWRDQYWFDHNWFDKNWWNKDWINYFTWDKYDENWYDWNWKDKNLVEWYHYVWVQFAIKYRCFSPDIFVYKTKFTFKKNQIINVPTSRWVCTAIIVDSNKDPKTISYNLRRIKAIDELDKTIIWDAENGYRYGIHKEFEYEWEDDYDYDEPSRYDIDLWIEY